MSELKSYQPERVSVRFRGCKPDANAFRLIGLAEYLKFNLSHPMKVSDIGGRPLSKKPIDIVDESIRRWRLLILFLPSVGPLCHPWAILARTLPKRCLCH